MKIPTYWLAISIALLSSCAKQLASSEASADCVPVAKLRLSRNKMSIINAALITRIDTRRVKFNLNRFCAYAIPTTNPDFKILEIYQPNISHVSQNWILLSKDQAIDTKLNRYFMVTDTIETQKLIQSSVNELAGASQSLRREITQILISKARFYYKEGDLSGVRK